MTARLPKESVRVTNWLAGWLDYVCATVLTAGRWLRVPAGRGAQEPVMMAAFAPTMDAYGQRWHEPEADEPGSGRLVRTLEIVMLSVSFFLAAHLLSGGTPTVSAPNVNFGFNGPRTQSAAALAVPAGPGKQVTFYAPGVSLEPATDPAAAIQQVTADAAPAAPIQEEAAVLAPAGGAGVESAAVAPEPAAPPPAPATVVEPPPPPAPSPVVEEPPVVALAPSGIPAEADRYLSVEEFHAAALTAGWPAALLPQLETVARCESHFRTGAFHLGARGLMQVLPNWFRFAGLDVALWYDPVTNLTAALAAFNEHTRYSGDGWSGWTCKP